MLIAAITAIAGLLWALNALQRSGFHFSSLNPFLAYRRWQWSRTYGGRPIYKLERPIDVAAVLLLGVAKADGAITSDQKRELLAMFHLYFVGSAEGLLFDVAADDFNTVFWNPLQDHLVRRGVQVLTGTAVDDLRFAADGPVRAAVGGSDADMDIEVDAVVLAADPRSTRRLVASATGLSTQGWRESLASTGNAPRFVVWRLWLDAPVRADRPAFLGTGGFDLLDNVSVLERYEAGARR